MSRELKFRAWESKEKRWAAHRIMPVLKSITERLMLKDCLPISGRLIIEQYTGLKDNNGKEIYEGDIVFFFTEHFDKATGGFDGEDEHNATVEWFDNGFAFMDKAPYDPNIECEVIGNIHENPELLGGEE